MSDQTKSTFARRVRTARPREKRYEVRDDVIPGLFLRISPSGARSFALERMARGRRQFATLGDADAMTISEARRGPQADCRLHRNGEERRRPQDAGASDGRLRRRVPRPAGPALEAPDA
ncbi:MAG: DUF4102 domain-containing protein [Boseongicola sp. SB0670_bin_30]|nr:DUF4102 domain-containing protein [Boseongicola sp. SB0670_bin_30]